ncbi:MAG: hypothetical protein MN733_34365 [Nitrososphaera sp.]|nr:hypothetical protein [Nitrososphaera sp.]
MKDSSGIIGKLESIEVEHTGHLSTSLVLSRYVAHQKQLSHSKKIEGALAVLGNTPLCEKGLNYV